ncbi:MAG: peptidylprolyl isomerase [Sphingomonadales bacterium RIFCSPHIGHO2_01_FULL_65_20]|jgi:cyclophilin family peptidyl-prolyl cis-trans isomerase|uniref:peptidylprolyl isomerase n=1 Tax=unclassified Blastomonas TaxID=2626550 RepID=UPI000832852A|nr:peptidylprolyl isomerase [Blastomonas sp.]MCH2237186.1 peptidylprolyl isomerase [Blastomonas sp.]OHC92610.1 MAG: peptidylprolyl isomerase [Sphingomonadales bacterium RIFCSPHIGHO2_01_FULL_65_20]
MTATRLRSTALRFAASLLPLTLLAASDPPPANPGPGDIIAAAPQGDWVRIPADDLLVMDLAPDAKGRPRRVVIQLMPAPFSSGWVSNIRKLAAAHWWDDAAIVRVQDNYVVQWGDPDAEDEAKAKPLPAGIAKVPEGEYVFDRKGVNIAAGNSGSEPWTGPDAYAKALGFSGGWPLAGNDDHVWPVHCYGMVGVGRNLSPDTGSGAELYTVIGHAPRHLDRNIALVGRVVEGIEHMSSLPRGTGALGFYESPEERTVIRSVRLATELPEAERPRLEYLNSSSESFVAYARARANRKDAFFNIPAGGADICNIPVPIRKITQ